MPSTIENTETADLSISEVAARSGMSEHTLRYYERVGLITPIRRDTSSGHRRYPACTVALIESLQCLRKSGLSIEDMRSYLARLKRGAVAAAEQRAFFTAHKETIEREIEDLQLRKRYIEGKIAYWTALENGDAEEAERISVWMRDLARMLK